MRHILVVANQTVAGDELIDAVRSKAAGEPVRVTVICPQNDPSGDWVVDDREVAQATRARLEATLDRLRAAGIQATGQVVDRDPYTAVMDEVESDRPSEIIISTLPQTRSGWLRRDLVERVRHDAKIPVDRNASRCASCSAPCEAACPFEISIREKLVGFDRSLG